jgi:hypothetical protein
VVVAQERGRPAFGEGNVSKETALTEKGETVKGRGDTPNEHDILTGSDPAGMYSTAGGDTTCGNWTRAAKARRSSATTTCRGSRTRAT